MMKLQSHSDILVYIIVYRTLPFVNVTVEIDDFQDVTLTERSVFRTSHCHDILV